MATLASLAIELTANSAKMVSELQKANNKLTGFEKTARVVGKAVKGALIAATTGIFAKMTVETLNAGAEIKRLARIAGTSTGEFQQLAIETKKIGIESEKLADILKDTNDKIGDFIATGGGAAVDFFENIAPLVGVTVDQFKNLSGKDALQLYIDSLNKANLSQQEMTFYMEAIASDATALLPVFAANSEAAKRMSVILSDVDLENMTKAKEAIDDATSALDGMSNKLIAALAPAITSATEKLVEFFATMANGDDSIPVLERRIAELNASLRSVGTGRNAPSLRRGINKQLEELNDQLRAAKALAGDADLAEQERVSTNADLLKLKTQLEAIDGSGRSTAARAQAIRDEIQALKEYDEQLKVVIATKSGEDTEGAGLPNILGANQDLDALLSGKQSDSLFAFDAEDPLTRILGGNPDDIKERLTNQLASESELIDAEFIKRQEQLWALRERDLLSQKKYEELSLKNTKKYANDQAKACKIKNQAIFNCDEQRMRMTLAATASFFGIMAAKNKKFAIAQALINTYLGVSESLAAYPMPLAAIMAASHLAAGLQTVQSIKSGGGGGGVSSSASVTTSLGDSGVDSTIEQVSQFSPPEQVLDVTLNVDDEALLTKNQLRQLMEQINEASGNRRIRIN